MSHNFHNLSGFRNLKLLPSDFVALWCFADGYMLIDFGCKVLELEIIERLLNLRDQKRES